MTTECRMFELKIMYRKTLELALIFSLILHLGLFYGLPEFQVTPRTVDARPIEIQVADIPPTEQVRMQPAPARPSVPIPTESEEVPEDVTIESTELILDLTNLPPPPGPTAEKSIDEGYVFVPYDEPPYPIGGYAAIQRNLKYPEIARKAGVEGRVAVGVLIDEAGNVVKTQILKASGGNIGFEDAAVNALKSVKWKPALQRDQPVKVWVSVPIVFKLESHNQTT